MTTAKGRIHAQRLEARRRELEREIADNASLRPETIADTVRSVFGPDVTLTWRSAEEVEKAESTLREPPDDSLEAWRRRLANTCPRCGLTKVKAGKCLVCGARKKAMA